MRRTNKPSPPPHFYWNPTLTVTTSAPPESALAALVDALVGARYQVLDRGPGRAELRIGSFWREHVSDSLGLSITPILPTWAFRATVDLEVLDTAPPTQVRVLMHKKEEPKLALAHLLRAVEAALQTLRAADHHAEAGEVGEGPRRERRAGSRWRR